MCIKHIYGGVFKETCRSVMIRSDFHYSQYCSAHKHPTVYYFFLLHTIIFCKQVFTVTMRKREGKKNKSILAVKNSLGFSVEY